MVPLGFYAEDWIAQVAQCPEEVMGVMQSKSVVKTVKYKNVSNCKQQIANLVLLFRCLPSDVQAWIRAA